MDSPAVQSSINIDPNPVNPAAEPADRLPVSRVLLAKAIHPRVGVVFILLVLASIGVVESIQSRDAEGLPAASIFWGVVATIGIVLGVGVAVRNRSAFTCANAFGLVGLVAGIFIFNAGHHAVLATTVIATSLILMALLVLARRDFPPRDPSKPSIWAMDLNKLDGPAFRLGAAGLVIVFACIGLFVWTKMSLDKNANTTDSSANSAPALPTIKVLDLISDQPDTSVRFFGWKIEGFTLAATMIWNGSEKIGELTYTAKRGGVVVNRGNVYVPGDGMRAHEPTEVHIAVNKEITADMEITVEVAH